MDLFNRLALVRLPSTSPFSPDLIRVTHARPLNPAALAFVPFGLVLVRVRVQQLFLISNAIDVLYWIFDLFLSAPP